MSVPEISEEERDVDGLLRWLTGKEPASSAGDTACDAYVYLNHFVVYLKLHNTVILQHTINRLRTKQTPPKLA